MPRFYIDPPAGDFVTLTGEDARHICRSLRMAVGEALTLCDGAGIDYNGVLRQTDGLIATVEILSRQPSQTEPTVSIRLFQALPKGDKMEWIIQKAVELGISEVVPVLTERCISRPDEKSMEKKLLRWQKIAGSRQAVRPQPYSYRLPPDVVFAGGAGAGFHGKGIVSLRKRRPAFKKGPMCAGSTDRHFCWCRRRVLFGRSPSGPRGWRYLYQLGQSDPSVRNGTAGCPFGYFVRNR